MENIILPKFRSEPQGVCNGMPEKSEIQNVSGGFGCPPERRTITEKAVTYKERA